MTDECLASNKGCEGSPTRTVTGAIVAPQEIQRMVVSGKTGNCSPATPGIGNYVPTNPGGEM